MKKKFNGKYGVIAAAGVTFAAVTVFLGTAAGAGSAKKVVSAVRDIKKGTIINDGNIEELFALDGAAEKGDAEYITETDGLDGMIAAEDIPCGVSVETGMFLNGYEPISRIKNPVIMGIHAGEASQFVSGIIRRGDTINISVVDSLTGECESVLEDVYVCGAYNDDGSPIEDGEGSAKSLNILVERADEARLNALMQKGIIRISKTGSGLND